MRAIPASPCLAFAAALALAVPAAGELPREDRVPGGIAVLPLDDATRPEVRLDGQRVLVAGAPGRWHAVAGIGLDRAPGSYALEVSTAGMTRTIPFQVGPKDYATQHVRIADERKVSPLPADLERIDHEAALMNGAREHWTDLDAPRLELRPPLPGRQGANYGLRRVLNGAPRDPHAGMDIKAPQGTPVLAAAPGRVALVGDFFFNGRTVFIDHGQRLVTMYCHLDRADVTEGDNVSAGVPIGAVGKTGRASGPHLHFSVYLNGAAINPALLLGKYGDSIPISLQRPLPRPLR